MYSVVLAIRVCFVVLFIAILLALATQSVVICRADTLQRADQHYDADWIAEPPCSSIRMNTYSYTSDSLSSNKFCGAFQITAASAALSSLKVWMPREIRPNESFQFVVFLHRGNADAVRCSPILTWDNSTSGNEVTFGLSSTCLLRAGDVLRIDRKYSMSRSQMNDDVVLVEDATPPREAAGNGLLIQLVTLESV